MKRPRQEEDQAAETLTNSINVTPIGAFALEWTCDQEWPEREIVRRIYLVNGSQPHVKLIIDSNPNWRYVDFLGKNWSIVQHERVVNLGINGRGKEWQGSAPEVHRLLLGDLADLRVLMQLSYVVGHDRIHIVKSFLPFEIILSQIR